MKYCTLLALLLILSCALVQAEEYLIRPGDTLGVTVLGEPELTRRVVVSPQGSLTLPLINEVQVANMSTTKAAETIAGLYKKYVKNPQVTVELAEAAKLHVTVSGEVHSQGIHPIQSDAHLLDAITAAGGYLPTADLSKISVCHAGSDQVMTVDLNKFLVSGDTGANILLTPGDMIIVPSKGSAVIGTVTVLGAVRQTGAHSITQGMTVREAIMLAGGPTEFADVENMTLRREGSTEATRFDYAQALAGDQSANIELKPGDVIYVASTGQLGYYTISGAVGAAGRYEIKGKTTITEAIAIAGGIRGRAKLGDVRILRSQDGQSRTMRADVSDILAGRSENLVVMNQDTIFVPEGKQPTDILRYLSLGLSLAWLLTRN